MRKAVIAAVLAFLIFPAVSSAALITFTAEGVINDRTIFRPPSLAFVDLGDPFTMSFTFDTSVADTIVAPGGGGYPGAVKDIVYRIPSRGVELTAASADLTISNFATNTDVLRFQVGDIIDGYVLNFWFRDTGGTALNATGDDIPEQIDPGAFNLPTVSIYQGAIATGGSTSISGDVSAVTVSVPEPATATAILLVGGFVMLARRGGFRGLRGRRERA